MAEGQAPELRALNQNISSITARIGGDNLQWFSNKLMEKAFSDRTTAQGIVTTTMPVANKVGRLLDCVYSAIEFADNKRERYNSFVDIFSHDAAYSDLVRRLNHSIPTTAVETLTIMLREKEAELTLAKETIIEQQHQIQTKNWKLSQTQQQLTQKEEFIFAMSFTATLCFAFLLPFYINHEAKEDMNVTISKLNETIEAIRNMTEAEVEKKENEMNVIIAKLNETMETRLVAEIERKANEMNLTITKLQAELNETMMRLQTKENQLSNIEKMERELEMNITFTEIQNDLNTTMIKLCDTEENVSETNLRILMKIKPIMKYSINFSGPGLTSATVNGTTYILVELTDTQLQLKLNVTAQLELIPRVTPTNLTEATSTNQPTTTSLSVVMKSSSRYEVLYTAVSRGQHKLHIQVNNKQINGSPFRVTVYPDPRQLDHPVRTVTDLNYPCGIAFTNHEQIIVSECNYAHRVSILDIGGKKIRTFGTKGYQPDEMNNPHGVATDDADNIYVSSEHKLQKFTSNGKLIICIGQKGHKEVKFNTPFGITVYNNQVYVCDTYNHHIKVFDLDLNFVRSIGSHGKGRGEFDRPFDVKFDTNGNMYVAEFGNSRIQVLDGSGQFIQSLGQEEGKGKLSLPSGLHIADKYVYVSDNGSDSIVVYETSGQFVTLFGRYNRNDRESITPRCITSDVHGFIYVCDTWNKRVQIF